MSVKFQFALIFLVGLLAGVVIESHVLSVFSPARSLSAGATDSKAEAQQTAPKSLASDPRLTAESAPAVSRPQISVDEPRFVFGDQDAGSVVEHTFTLKNQGDEMLRINRVLSSCGCTTATLSNNSIPPGSTTDIRAKLDLHSQRGPQDRSIIVQSNDPETPNLKLSLIGNAIYHVLLSPTRVIVEDSASSEPFMTTVSVRSDRYLGGLQIKDTETSGDNVVAEVEPLDEGTHYAVKVKVTPEDGKANSTGWVRLLTDQSGEYQSIVIPITHASELGPSSNQSTPRPQNLSPTLNAKVGDTLELTGANLSGNPLKVSDFEGKLTAVIFWSSSCGACRNELGELKQLYADYHDKGFEVLGVSLDKSVERREQFLAEFELPWETLVSAEEGTGVAFAKQYQIRAVPSVLLLDRVGKVIEIDKRGQDLRTAVSELISEDAGG